MCCFLGCRLRSRGDAMQLMVGFVGLMVKLHVAFVCRSRALSLSSVPVALTCGFFEGVIIADPGADEEPLLSTSVTTVLDEFGKLLGARCRHCASSPSTPPKACYMLR